MTRRTAALAALSGLLLAASFPTVGISLLAWFGLVPFLFALRGTTTGQGFQLGLLTGIAFFGGTIYWVTNSINVYGHINLVIASGITLLLCAYCALYIGLFGAVAAHIGRTRPALLFLATPAAWTALELARTYVFSGFPWALLGYSQYRALHLIQISDITGVYGLSFLVVLANAGIASLFADRRRLVPPVAAVLCLLAVAAYGNLRLHEQSGAGSIRIAVVQGNIEQDKKWDQAFRSEVIDIYERLTRTMLPLQPDLVIWPETATPFYFGGAGGADAAMTADLMRSVHSWETPLLTGSPTYEKRDRTYLLKNSAIFLDRSGEVAGVYDKHHLVPFGEYVPLKGLFFFVNKMVEAVGDFQSGTAYTVVDVPAKSLGRPVPISVVICYEIIFPDLVRQFVDRGARVMTNITNDAWFGRTGAPYQHFSMAVFRAVENRVPIARAANTGVSGFIDAQGRILDVTGIFTEAARIRDLPIADGTRTFYTRYGDVFAYLCVAAVLALLALRTKREQQQPSTLPREQ
jgi:apolipoprotein N-acyltransferase